MFYGYSSVQNRSAEKQFELQRRSPAGHPRLQRRIGKSKIAEGGMKTKVNGKAKRVELGKHIVADPDICHGKPSFKGTRVMVFQVLEQVACGTPWERIVWSWRGKVPMEAITEAVKLASELFKDEERFRAAC